MISGLESLAEKELGRITNAVGNLVSGAGEEALIHHSMKTLKDMPDLKGKTVFLRLDFNVPVQAGRITDYYRIKKAVPTIQALRARGAKLIIASHIETKENPTLAPVYAYLRGLFPNEVIFIEDYFPNDIRQALEGQGEGQIALLENLRKYPGEKENDPGFARHLASFADFYVDDAFATAHRKHASIVGVPEHIPGYAGLLIEEEVKNLSFAFNPPHPFVFVLGGAKFDTKLPLVRKFLGLADTVFVGGALANDLFKANGFETGRSLLSEGFDASDLLGSEKLMVPSDVVIENEAGRETKHPSEIRKGDAIMDAGPATIEDLRTKIAAAEFVLWNGPLGVFEKNFRDGTDALAGVIAEAHGKSVVGGGDTLASISSLGLDDKFSFISTGGGAMLDFLAHGTLPGIEALT